MKKRIFYLLLAFSISTFMFSCKSDDDTTPDKEVVHSFDIALNTANAIPMVSGRDEAGNITMKVYDDNTMDFTITINNLSASDALTMAHVHLGTPVSTGAVAITLVDNDAIKFDGGTATGTLTLTANEVATLTGDNVYVNVHSTESPAGLVRGQIDVAITEAYNVALSPENEVPAITDRNETGVAYFRLVDKKLFYKVIVNDLDTTDEITAAHIHEGAAGENGGVMLLLIDPANSLDLDQSHTVELSDEDLAKLTTDPLYVNVHSMQHASGLLRGQIR